MHLLTLLSFTASGQWPVRAAHSWAPKGADVDGEAAEDNSAASVALSADGTILAIGAQYNDGNDTNSGHVRVYEWNDAAWAQKGADIDGEAAGDESGQSVALSANGAIVAIGCSNVVSL